MTSKLNTWHEMHQLQLIAHDENPIHHPPLEN